MSYLDYIRYSIANTGNSYLLPSGRIVDAYFNNFSRACPILTSPCPTDLLGDIYTLYAPTARTTYLCLFVFSPKFILHVCSLQICHLESGHLCKSGVVPFFLIYLAVRA
jgi:hypothetical protein